MGVCLTAPEPKDVVPYYDKVNIPQHESSNGNKKSHDENAIEILPQHTQHFNADSNQTNKTEHNDKMESDETIERRTSSIYHFIIPDDNKENKEKYSTFVDYNKLFAKTSNVEQRGRTNLIEIEQKEMGIVLDQQTVAYNSWCTVKTSPSLIDQSKPKRIHNGNNNDNNNNNNNITALPSLSHSGDNEQRSLLMGFIREMVNRFDFSWILPQDVIDVCYSYLLYNISPIFVITGNISNYMEYHLFTAQNNDYEKYKYSRLQFKMNDIEILNEDFDCAYCGICYAQNIKIPSSMHITNELIDYSALIKCGGEIIEDDMNFCTNYCNLIMFDTNELLTQNDVMDINCFELKLPRLKTKCQYKSIYSECHGLIAMGMDRKRNETCIYQLSFKHRLNDDYDWKPLTKLKYNHLYGSICMINNDENLVVLGGNDSNKMEIFDWNTTEWNTLTNVHYNTKYSGICYNFLHSNIVICGGYGASCKKSACYDIIKDKWFKLPSLQYKHRCYPTVFNHIDNPSITYCFGDNNESFSLMEYVDLRDNEPTFWSHINEADMYHHISPSQIRNIVI